MKRFNELVREIRDQAALASGGSLDRPTSLYQSGSVGREQRAPVQRPVEEPMLDQATERRRPTAAPSRAGIKPRTTTLRTMLATPGSLRTAILIGEVLGPPVSQRDERRSTGGSIAERKSSGR